MAESKHPKKISCVLIAGGKWHDIDFARLELMKLLAEDERVRVRVFEDYENIAAIEKAAQSVARTHLAELQKEVAAHERERAASA